MPDNFTTSLCTIFGLSSFALPLPSSFPAQQPPATADAPVLVYGAGSSSGQYMIQIFKLSGFTNIIGIASPRNHEYLKELGAKHCFDYRSPTLAQDVLSATEGVKVALAVDNIATKTTLTAISQVVGKGSKLAILMPVKDGETVTNPVDKEMYIGLPPFVNPLFEETEVYTVYTFKNQEVSHIIFYSLYHRFWSQGNKRILSQGKHSCQKFSLNYLRMALFDQILSAYLIAIHF